MQFDHLRRREFITLLGGSAAAWPLAARAQQSAMPVIGLLQVVTAGFVEGLNLAIEYRFANDDPDRLPELASDLVRRRVRVIAAIASALATRAAKAATDTIPIVFGHGLDPVEQGHVASLNHPAGNVTGITSRAGDLFSKQLGILHELLPQAIRIGVLGNPKGLQYEFRHILVQ
jgi:putative ABC transport system substrate-binding protein